MSDTDKSELRMRDYRQYVSWQVVALLRSLKVVSDLTPMQMKLVEAKADLMAETIKSDVTQQCNQARIDEHALWKPVAEEIVAKDGVYRAVNFLNKRASELTKQKEKLND